MSRRNRYGWYEPAAKKPAPPDGGIRMKKAGTTWWGQHWIAALVQVLRGDSARLARGRTYARGGRAHDLEVVGGRISAKVTGSRARPYTITIELTQLGEGVWRKAIAAMASQARFSAELLAGQMPPQIEEAFVEAGASLFPKQRADLTTSCSCPDWGDPCKHVAATHYVLGEALDRDPFLLFELRGKTKEQVLAALRAARGAGDEAPVDKRAKAAKVPAEKEALVPTVKLGKVKPGDYDRPREPLPAMHFTFEQPAAPGAMLRQLGAPAGWTSDASPAEVLAPLVRAAAETARQIAMAEPSPVDDASGSEGSSTAKRATKKRVTRRARGR